MYTDEIKWEDYFYYDETSPSCLKWNVSRYSGKNNTRLMVSKGEFAGSLSKQSGYWKVVLLSNSYMCHRIIYELQDGTIPDEMQIDHINGVRGDNKIVNLRVVSRAVNMRNMKKRQDNLSGVAGVHYQQTSAELSYWTAQWKTASTGKQEAKCFPIHKLGNDEAFRLACEYRDEMIEKLNTAGAGYTERHGQYKGEMNGS